MVKKAKYAAIFALTTMGLLFLFLSLYCEIGNPETFTHYELLMTVVASANIADKICKEWGTSDA